MKAEALATDYADTALADPEDLQKAHVAQQQP